ncbi:PREDICTED: uncharacterized protein LOC101292027 [Fragaria vesca subsp. vesca]
MDGSSSRPQCGFSSYLNPVMGSSPTSKPGVGSSRYSLGVQMCTKREVEPIFGCTITPSARLINPTVFGEQPPEHKFNFKWYWKCDLEAHRDEIRFCVHHDVVATIQSAGETSSDNQPADEEKTLAEYNDNSLDKHPKLELDGKIWVEDLCPSDTIETVPVRYVPGQKPRCILECQQKSGDSHIRSILKAHSSGGVKISVLSYNVLTDIYAHDDQYSDLPKWSLTWEYCPQNLLDEIIEYDADILCLQEIYTSHGYCMDGCAIFYHCDVFKEIVKYEREFDSSLRVIGELQLIERERRDEAFQRRKQREADSSLRRVLEALEALQPQERDEAFQRLKKANVAHVVTLEKLESKGTCKGIQPRICVANTHIYSDPWSPDVKLFQVVDLITGLDKMAKTEIPMLVCGDFNSVPLSAPHQFITTRKLGNLPDTDQHSICLHLKPDHSLPLKSAYASSYNSDGVEEEQCKKFWSESGEPLFTHSTRHFQGTLDDIFYTDAMIKNFEETLATNRLATESLNTKLGEEYSISPRRNPVVRRRGQRSLGKPEHDEKDSPLVGATQTPVSTLLKKASENLNSPSIMNLSKHHKKDPRKRILPLLIALISSIITTIDASPSPPPPPPPPPSFPIDAPTLQIVICFFIFYYVTVAVIGIVSPAIFKKWQDILTAAENWFYTTDHFLVAPFRHIFRCMYKSLYAFMAFFILKVLVVPIIVLIVTGEKD